MICYRFILLILICSWSEMIPAQQEKRKASKESYRSFANRSSVNAANNLLRGANEIKISNPSLALEKVREALGMSIAQRDEFTEAKSYILLGEIN